VSWPIALRERRRVGSGGSTWAGGRAGGVGMWPGRVMARRVTVMLRERGRVGGGGSLRAGAWPRRVAVPLRAWPRVGPPRPAWAHRLPSHCAPVALVRLSRCCLHARLAVWLGPAHRTLSRTPKNNKKADSLSCAAVALCAPSPRRRPARLCPCRVADTLRVHLECGA